MERLKFLLRALHIGVRVSTTGWVPWIVDLVAAFAVLGIAVGVQFAKLPEPLKVMVPVAAVVGVLFEGSFRLWREAELARVVAEALPVRDGSSEARGIPVTLFQAGQDSQIRVGSLVTRGMPQMNILDSESGVSFDAGRIRMDGQQPEP